MHCTYTVSWTWPVHIVKWGRLSRTPPHRSTVSHYDLPCRFHLILSGATTPTPTLVSERPVPSLSVLILAEMLPPAVSESSKLHTPCKLQDSSSSDAMCTFTPAPVASRAPLHAPCPLAHAGPCSFAMLPQAAASPESDGSITPCAQSRGVSDTLHPCIRMRAQQWWQQQLVIFTLVTACSCCCVRSSLVERVSACFS
jgi:hypothetical protein